MISIPKCISPTRDGEWMKWDLEFIDGRPHWSVRARIVEPACQYGSTAASRSFRDVAGKVTPLVCQMKLWRAHLSVRRLRSNWRLFLHAKEISMFSLFVRISLSLFSLVQIQNHPWWFESCLDQGSRSRRKLKWIRSELSGNPTNKG